MNYEKTIEKLSDLLATVKNLNISKFLYQDFFGEILAIIAQSQILLGDKIAATNTFYKILITCPKCISNFDIYALILYEINN